MKRSLVIIDVQNDFIDGCLGDEEAEKIVPLISEWIEAFPYDNIILTQDTHGDNYLDTQEGKKLPIPHCIQGSHGWEIAESLLKTLCEHDIPHTIIGKNTFGYIDWIDVLRDSDVITIVGLKTDICVISNALIIKCLYPEAKIIIISHLCAGTSLGAHEEALRIMKNCQITVM